MSQPSMGGGMSQPSRLNSRAPCPSDQAVATALVGVGVIGLWQEHATRKGNVGIYLSLIKYYVSLNLHDI